MDIYLFKKISDIVTIGKSKVLKLNSYTVDFEIGLVNALRKVFKNNKCVGCYYHYTRALRETARDMKLLTKDKK